MITVKIGEGINVCNGKTCRSTEYYGKSSDTKPVDGVNNADIFYEMDTKKVFLFDEEKKTWLEQ